MRAQAPIFAAESVMRHAQPLPAEAAGEELGAEQFPALGLTVQTLTPDLAAALGWAGRKGVLVGGSRQPGIQKGDLVLAVGETAVRSVPEFAAAVERRAARKLC